MGSVNISIIISLVVSAGCLACLLWVVSRQFLEVLLPKDWLTKLRWLILLLLLTSILGVIPVITYQYLRLVGDDSETLRNIASVTGNISRLATGVLLVMIYKYKKKEES